MAICKVDGCDSKVYVIKSGLCSKHYNRLRTTGTTDSGSKARGSVEERFWRYIDRRGDDDCWEWTGKSKVEGYGTIGLGGRQGKKVLAHRLSWTIHNGDIPEGEGYHGGVVMHKCDNRLCCNPNHLMLGSQYDNVRDMMDKRRDVRNPNHGVDHQNAIFTNDDLDYILTSSDKIVDKARKLGCHPCTVSRVINGVTYKNRETKSD